MPDNAAQDRQSGRPLPVTAYSLVERQRVELPIEDKWPKAWRLLFVTGVAVIFWGAFALLLGWFKV